MDPDLFYHTANSLRKQGLREIPKDADPSPYGGSLYYDEPQHFLGRMISLQRLFFDAQNIMGHAKDRTKKDVQKATELLPRSYEEWVEAQKKLTGTVRAMEMAHGKKEGI
jgi:hypothetical protein